MPVDITALDISEQVAAGIASGEYVKDGDVVRDLAGRLVALLKEVSLPTEGQEIAAGGIAKALTSPKVIAIGLGLGALTATAGGVAGFVLGKKKQAAKLERPKSVENCIASLSAYLEAVQNGSLDVKTLHRLNSDLDAVNKEAGSGRIEILAEQLEVLIAIVADHTWKLAEAKAVDLSEVLEQTPQSGDSKIVSLQRHLRVQERILKRSA
ncbi:hypothetical protein ACFFMM_00375 [Micromonospora chaiyaphumensis]|uniref:Uncharacterized protein n=1 Tax=Micromonospora chaiyaphumensis TaxID=307119 RepID=A0A1C4ZIT3_9ACTN|nr:hypothetical protein [Micromonospora chaiyaphumensis]SCF32746.1 hypothetical protein GA0070214_11519 [Micromonospora chaiyaphumensis]